ncbi:DNA polymerase III subunit beta [Haloplasma contractile]|uniref:Beta sliding clamp n=1 Tax=Haloplasma contractile SSD-17B TaxID=1033810 RepID=F7PT47_9MOLU|nr:DNA polymerase III subunit beta [Haloplasma contractile]ERJ12537.1 DNA polymerase III subunit beta protein [Haloplasma contractile SSD-17B]
MKFKIKSNYFAKGINIVSKALSTKTPMPILKSIKISTSNQGITLMASDSNITIKYFLPTEDHDTTKIFVEEEGEAAVPGRLMLDMLKKVTDENIEIALYENKFIKVNFGHSDYTLNCLDVREYPDISLISAENPIPINIADLNELIKQTSISISLSENRPILTGINFKLENQMLTCIATDSYRLSQKMIQLDNNTSEPLNIVIPGKSLIELEKILSGMSGNVELHSTPNIVSFKINNLTFQSRLLDGNYPETSRLIPKEFGLTTEFNRSELIHVIDRVSLLSREGATNIIKFDIYDEKTIVSLDSPEVGRVVEELHSTSQEGSPIRIGFNSKYLLDALKVLESEVIKIQFTGEVRPFILKTDDDSVIQLILPVRIE